MGFVDPTGLLGVFVGETIVRGAGAGLAKGLARTAANIGANLLVKQITPAGSTRVDKPILPSQIKPSKPQATPQPQLSASKPRSTFQLNMKALSVNMEYWQNYGGGGILHTLASPVTDIIASHYETRLNDGMYGRSYWRGVGIRAKGTQKAFAVITALEGGEALFGGAAVKGGTVQVEQYALRAADDGFYPVMKRGFANPQELTWLNKGDVWKFGTTKNPLTRYSQSYLDNVGEFGVYYKTEFTGILKEALTVERMKILNFKGQNKLLPAGNKKVK
jgi:hypothetical protein